MSTILKALERLEKDKQGGAPAEGARELAVVRPGVPQEPRRRWPWIAGGIGALALTGVLALWLRPLVAEPPAEQAAEAGASIRPVPPPAPPALQEPVAVAAVEPAPAPVPPPDAALLPGPQAPSPSASAEPLPPPAAPAAPPEPALQAAAPAPAAPLPPPEPAPLATAEPPAEIHLTLPGVAPVEPEPVPAPIAEPEPAPPPPARQAVRARPPAPKPRPAPAVARAPEPKVAVERTIWHPDAKRRRAWVRVEGRASAELREGDALGGIAVRRIEPSGVVFAFEGRELRRAVGVLP